MTPSLHACGLLLSFLGAEGDRGACQALDLLADRFHLFAPFEPAFKADYMIIHMLRLAKLSLKGAHAVGVFTLRFGLGDGFGILAFFVGIYSSFSPDLSIMPSTVTSCMCRVIAT